MGGADVAERGLRGDAEQSHQPGWYSAATAGGVRSRSSSETRLPSGTAAAFDKAGSRASQPLAALRVRYAVCHTARAGLRTDRRAPPAPWSVVLANTA
ncbi:hypothetical protein STRIP9103_09319 [Streptomyces ipomoeae 91-03]|uniref:Uncharacterized protein n=1 Tax=Streptomyces ipomoeae 91-03 TaxID=698759 RepID=L1L6B8_9ACTN|nr:hypothetical protein STRIP9103_09319 [Streptomyces ipomoeae 91-03]